MHRRLKSVYVFMHKQKLNINNWMKPAHLWDTCACPCRCRRTWLLQTGRSWCWPEPRRSACRAARPQTPSYWDPSAGQGSARSCCRRSPRGWPAPGTARIKDRTQNTCIVTIGTCFVSHRAAWTKIYTLFFVAHILYVWSEFSDDYIHMYIVVYICVSSLDSRPCISSCGWTS